MPFSAACYRVPTLCWLAVSLMLIGAGCRKRPPRVETLLIYDVDPQAVPQGQPLNMAEVLAACRRRLSRDAVPLGEVRQCGARQIEIGVYGKDPALIQHVQTLLTMRGAFELRILANRRDHLAIIERALKEPGEHVCDEKQKPLARWTPIWPGRKAGFSTREGIVTRTRRIDHRDQLEVLVVYDLYNITGEFLVLARVSVGADGYPEVDFRLNTVGGRLLNQLTAENLPDPRTSFMRQLGILLNGQLISAPNLQAVISDSARITGRFTREEAQLLADVLNACSLPVPLRAVGRK